MLDGKPGARRLSQRALELRAFRKLLGQASIDLRGKHLLDAGCGNGFGLELIAKAFRPARLAGFDPMPEQIERAKRRGLSAEIAVGDITAIAHADVSFDGVFVFGILHHVPQWRVALREIARVLRPGGVLLVEENHGGFIRVQDKLIGTSHPKDAAFDWPQFSGGLADAGLEVVGDRKLLGSAIRTFAAMKREPRRTAR